MNRSCYSKSLFFCLLLMPVAAMWGQTGTEVEPVRYIGREVANPNYHDGALPYAIGVENIQVMRANRTHLEYADHFDGHTIMLLI